MDQIKEKLAVAARYSFWIVSGVVLLGSVAIWYLATNRLASENEQQTRQLKQDIQSVRTVSSELPTHPNDYSHARMEELIGARTDEVLEAWDQVYTRQSDILTWPSELGQDFVDEFKDLIPIELHVDFPPTNEQKKKTELLTRYDQYIATTLPKIARMAKTEWKGDVASASSGSSYETAMMGGSSGSRSGSSDDEGPLVEWSKVSQQRVLDDLFPWLGNRPTTLEVYYSQENIWILKQLLQIIADVNGDAQQRFQAKIHKIDLIQIGQSVDFDSGEIAEPGQDSRGTGGGMGEFYMDDSEDYGGGGDYYSMEGGTTTGTTASDDPAHNRYVDINKEPIAAADLRARLKSNSPADATIAVAKRVPVMMSLQMDQRHVQRLLAACGSAPLMVEVGQVKILPKGTGASASGGGGGSGYGDEAENAIEEPGYGDEYGSESIDDPYGSSAALPVKEKEEFPLDVSVEVYGLIYVYNPPDLDKLGVEKVVETVSIDGASEGTATADQPAENEATASTPPATTETESAEPGQPQDAGQPQPAEQPDQQPPDGSQPQAPAPANGQQDGSGGTQGNGDQQGDASQGNGAADAPGDATTPAGPAASLPVPGVGQ